MEISPLLPSFEDDTQSSKVCTKCGRYRSAGHFPFTRSTFFADGRIPICDDCIKKYLIESNFEWAAVDKLCQMADIPFVPTEFERLHEMNGDDVFPRYALIFQDKEYESFGWDDYFKEFKRLRDTDQIEQELPELREEYYKKLRKRWGGNYDEEALDYLENLLNGLLATQNVNGDLQMDQAKKVCKISYEIDCRIRDGSDFDKILTAYDKLVKTAEFTPKNVKNLNDFDTIGELVKWMEKRGWKNQYYDGVAKDVVDETIQNIQVFNRRLYVNESGIGEEISRRLEALKDTDLQEKSTYNTQTSYDIDEFENDGYEKLIGDADEFDAELGGDANGA